jgi:hypothetical protein
VSREKNECNNYANKYPFINTKKFLKEIDLHVVSPTKNIE